MRVLKKIFLVLLILIALAVGGSYLLPRTYHVERAVATRAKPEALYVYVGDLKRWEEWTAWNKEMDPTMERAYQGSEKGAGSKMTWKGNQVGKGSVLITKGEPAKGITYDLEFEDGKYRSNGELRFEPAGSDTRVMWTNDGDAGWNPVARVFNLFMDRLIGPDFQKGLDKLKALAEARA